MDTERKPVLHIEILKRRSAFSHRSLIEDVDSFLQEKRNISTDSIIKEFAKSSLHEHLIHIRICEIDSASDTKHIDISTVQPKYYIYQLECYGPGIEELNEGEDDIPAATHWMLPATEFEDLWENLIYDMPIKEQMLKFVRTALLFSDKGMNKSIISWNKVILLHGPPGTGKTSLCKALAQKLSIRLDSRYKYAQLVEINSHSLFSKWFSESGKLVQKMFTKITDLADDHHLLLIVLIDEVESLTRARESSTSGSDPSDAVRVVNAVLTQLDQINKYPNVLIVTTSNISGTIDLAFVDRADIKQYIGLPSRAAIYQIYYSCITEMKRTGIIADSEMIFTLRELETTNMIVKDVTKSSLLLWEISGQSLGFSGRTLRKIPFLAHALYAEAPVVSLPSFLTAMQMAVEKQKQDRLEMPTVS
ncbi:pachytene checkpoint protein 2 homolog [Procambarus clarkii]|uniref:pachytene checkpoint protein 2 homolog n=1 Tax=Procambarus clarkii TaxID=6728 RepID=UPI001E6726E8|nr:pachytene checkpoint protein 2 homolog [Procambarus clarkii]